MLAVFSVACATTKVEVTPVTVEPIEQIKSAPFNVEEVYDDAIQDFEKNDYLSALNGFKQVQAYDPDRLTAVFWQAEAYLALGEYEKAANIYWAHNWSFLNDDLSQKMRTGKVLSGVYTDRYEKPEAAIHEAMVEAPNDPRLWNAKGQYHDRQEEWMDALSAYIEAMKSGKWQAGTINNMGMSLLMQGRLKEAENKFKQAHEMSPDIRVYDNNLRMAYILNGDLKKALADMDESRAANVLNDAGFVALSRDKKDLAKTLFNKALEISPVFHAKAQANLDRIVSLEAAARSKSARTTP